MLAAKARAALSCAAPPGAMRLIPRPFAAAFNRIASAILADMEADAEADALADAEADAEVAIEAPIPGVARLSPVRLFSDDSAAASFINSASAAAAGLSKAFSSAPSPGIDIAIDRAVTFMLAVALALNFGKPNAMFKAANASKLAIAEAEMPSVAEADALALALAEALAFIAALAAALNRPTPMAVVRSGPSKSISIASGRFFNCAIIAARLFTHMQLTSELRYVVA